MAANKLWKTSDISNWEKYFVAYDKVLSIMADRKKKKKLVSLDNWFQKCLGKNIRTRNIPFIEKSELVKLMDWKLTRGKFRPRLSELIESNAEDKIKKASESSFQQIAQPDVAIKELCQLRGVGPATASAVLTAFSPENFCFMADEAVTSVLPGKIDYTLKYYLDYLGKVSKKATELSKKHGHLWTPHDVECALWSSSLVSSYDIQLVELEHPVKNAKRKAGSIDKGGESSVSRKKKLKM